MAGLKTRLDKLEAPTVKRWREAWEQHAVMFDKHVSGLLDDLDVDDLIQRFEAAYPGLSADEQQAVMGTYLDGLGCTAHWAFGAWFELHDVHMPDADPPDLSKWPADIPTPPDEPPGDWEAVTPYLDSENVIEQVASRGYAFALATARAVREARPNRVKE